ncbi:hypothetical protein SODALDRAFT_340774 [Sodiomyces alkalinus F11]|uniref:C2H2-type domain-containing protein n=1 Tax=Sodiomyces alkalinus (strain CBS 110278 / VKM F-3762 / F11) TaxID=1314773 RepID=A0A3N2PSP5_SODAK|nr:hypothetical protein SODALDRAFT_340774 [Sodiomyces alkalinus F11]ROT37541.1 hypothetical protein SODALDRAFT_340774 [Sodiomyces alkalinus F11]
MAAIRQYQTYSMQMPVPVVTNIGGPGGPLAMMQGVHFAGFGHHPAAHHFYGHGRAPIQPDRPFKCDQCPTAFNRNHDLKRHKRIHLAVKPFPCDYCDKSFSRKDALKRHVLVKGCGQKKTPADGDDHGRSPRRPSSDHSAPGSPSRHRRES